MIQYLAGILPERLRFQPREAWPMVLERLGRWIDDVGDALRALPRLDVRVLPYVGGQTNVPVALPFRAVAVVLAGARPRGGDGTTESGAGITWAVSDGGYEIVSASGLTTGTKYELILVAMGVD